MKWTVELVPKARRQLDRMEPEIRLQVLEDLLTLGPDPQGTSSNRKKLKGFSTPTYRLRSGDYRAIYRIEGDIVVVGAIINRKDLSRELRSIKG